MKTFLVVNPHSANGQTGRKWPELNACLKRQWGSFECAFTEKEMHAAELTTRALHEGFELVVAVGGDGTLNEVVNGFFENGRRINPHAHLAVLPRGTGGDFRRSFSWSDRVEALAKKISQGDTMPLDVGWVEYTLGDGRLSSRYFANVASFGVSGHVAMEVNSSSKLFGGRVSFMLGSVRALAKYSDKKVRLSWNGSAAEEMRITAVAVANGRFFGGGMQVAPTAKVSDGVFDITVWSGYGLKDFIFKSKALYDGSHTSLEGTRTFQCQTLRAESEEEVLLDVDGEQPGRLPCEFRILPAALKLHV